MDDTSRIETFKQWLRVKYASDLTGLKRLIDALGTGDASESVIITSSGYEGSNAAGALVLEPLAKLNAALAVLGEMDPTAPTSPSRVRLADFRSFPQQR